VLSWDQAIALAEAPSERFRTMIYLAADSGMRWSELIGLRRKNVDVARRKVRVVEQLVQLEDRSWVRRPPKTSAGVRDVRRTHSEKHLLLAH